MGSRVDVAVSNTQKIFSWEKMSKRELKKAMRSRTDESDLYENLIIEAGIEAVAKKIQKIKNMR